MGIYSNLIQFVPEGLTPSLSSYIQPGALIQLQLKRECIFEISEARMARTFPGHYMRFIEELRIELPGLDGKTVYGELTQLSASLVRTADASASSFLMNGGDTRPGAAPARTTEARHAGFQVRDGVSQPLTILCGRPLIGQYHLKLPAEANRIDLSALQDVVIHVRYRAMHGGDDFASVVHHALPPFCEHRLVDLMPTIRLLSDDKDSAQFSVTESLFSQAITGKTRILRSVSHYVLTDPIDDSSLDFGVAPYLKVKSYQLPKNGGFLFDQCEINQSLQEALAAPKELKLQGEDLAQASITKAYLLLEVGED